MTSGHGLQEVLLQIKYLARPMLCSHRLQYSYSRLSQDTMSKAGALCRVSHVWGNNLTIQIGKFGWKRSAK